MQKNEKFREKCRIFNNKCLKQTFIKVKGENYLYDIIKLKYELSEQRILKFEQLIVAAIKLMIFTKFSHIRIWRKYLREIFAFRIFANFFSRNATQDFRIFSRKFRSLETLVKTRKLWGRKLAFRLKLKL